MRQHALKSEDDVRIELLCLKSVILDKNCRIETLYYPRTLLDLICLKVSVKVATNLKYLCS